MSLPKLGAALQVALDGRTAERADSSESMFGSRLQKQDSQGAFRSMRFELGAADEASQPHLSQLGCQPSASSSYFASCSSSSRDRWLGSQTPAAASSRRSASVGSVGVGRLIRSIADDFVDGDEWIDKRSDAGGWDDLGCLSSTNSTVDPQGASFLTTGSCGASAAPTSPPHSPYSMVWNCAALDEAVPDSAQTLAARPGPAPRQVPGEYELAIRKISIRSRIWPTCKALATPRGFEQRPVDPAAWAPGAAPSTAEPSRDPGSGAHSQDSGTSGWYSMFADIAGALHTLVEDHGTNPEVRDNLK